MACRYNRNGKCTYTGIRIDALNWGCPNDFNHCNYMSKEKAAERDQQARENEREYNARKNAQARRNNIAITGAVKGYYKLIISICGLICVIFPAFSYEFPNQNTATLTITALYVFLLINAFTPLVRSIPRIGTALWIVDVLGLVGLLALVIKYLAENFSLTFIHHYFFMYGYLYVAILFAYFAYIFGSKFVQRLFK